MTWRIERWSEDSKIAHKYRRLGLRELIIVLSADVDAALAELISKRLLGPETEVIQYLGANEDGRAPAGSFGARIQLALLLGILRESEAEFLRRLKALRNLMAHRMSVGFRTTRVQKTFGALVDSFWNLQVRQHPSGPDPVARRNSRAILLENQRVAKIWLVALVLTLQLGFLKLLEEMEQLPPLKHEGVLGAAIAASDALRRPSSTPGDTKE